MLKHIYSVNCTSHSNPVLNASRITLVILGLVLGFKMAARTNGSQLKNNILRTWLLYFSLKQKTSSCLTRSWAISYGMRAEIILYTYTSFHGTAFTQIPRNALSSARTAKRHTNTHTPCTLYTTTHDDAKMLINHLAGISDWRTWIHIYAAWNRFRVKAGLIK